MKRFCMECGAAAQQDDVVCTQCGVPLDKKETPMKNPDPVIHPRKPLTRKQKWLYSGVGLFVVLLIGFSMWVNSYFTEASVQERFEEAVASKDATRLSKMMIREDGQALSVKEAKAYLSLAAQQKKATLKRLYTIEKKGKFIGIYPKHVIKVKDQYATYVGVTENLTLTLGGKAAPVFKKEDNEIIYGPFTPGVYEVNAIFDGEFGKGSDKVKIALADPSSNAEFIELDLELGYVTFEIEGWDSYEAMKTWLLIGEKKIPFADGGIIDGIGPISVNGSQEVKIGIEMPWGEMLSPAIPIDDFNNSIRPTLIDEKQIDVILGVLKQYGEDYTEMWATHNPELLTTVSGSWKGVLAEDSKEYEESGIYFSGSFEKALIEASSALPIEDGTHDGIRMGAQFEFKSDFHELDEEAELEERVDSCEIELIYSVNSEKWLVNACQSDNLYFESSHEIPGSGQLYKPAEAIVKAEKDRKSKEEIEEFMILFMEDSVYAINNRDISLVERRMTTDGPRYKEASDYIDYLASKDIYEELIGTQVEKVEPMEADTFKITTIDEFDIIKPSSTDRKRFRTTTLIKKIDGEFYVHELVSTVEI